MKWHFVLYHEIPPICFWYPLSLGIHSYALQVFDRSTEVGSANNRIYGQDWAIESVRAHLHPDDDAGVHLGNWCTTRVHLMFAIVRMICFQIATSSSSICSLQQKCLQSTSPHVRKNGFQVHTGVKVLKSALCTHPCSGFRRNVGKVSAQVYQFGQRHHRPRALSLETLSIS